MNLNPIDDIVGAAKGVESAVLRKKRQLVKYVAGKSAPGGNAPIRGTGDRRPKQYKRGSNKTPFGR